MAMAGAGALVSSSDSGDEAGLGYQTCGTPSTSSWFVGVGATANVGTSLMLTNPDDSQAELDLRFYGPTGEVVVPGSSGIMVPTHTARTVSLPALVNLGGGPRPTPKTEKGVPIYIHDYFGPGRDAKVVSTKTHELKEDGLDYKDVPLLTGDESRAAEVDGVAFPRLLDPVDDVPPATAITYVGPLEGGRLVVRGTTSDNGTVRRVRVNGQEARALAANFAEWEAILTGVRPGTVKLAAGAEDSAGGLMTTDYVAASPNMTVADVIERIRKEGAEAETVYYIYVLAEDERLLGVVSLRDLLLANQTEKVKVGTIEYRKVKTGALQEDGLREIQPLERGKDGKILHGLLPGDVILIGGLQQVRPGAKVTLEERAMPTLDTSAAPVVKDPPKNANGGDGAKDDGAGKARGPKR